MTREWGKSSPNNRLNAGGASASRGMKVADMFLSGNCGDTIPNSDSGTSKETSIVSPQRRIGPRCHLLVKAEDTYEASQVAQVC